MASQSVESPPTSEQRRTMSYEEFLQWIDDETHAEWVNGEVLIFMPPLTIHQRIAGFLFNLLSLYARFLDLGEVIAAPFEMRHLPGRSSREPDLLFVAREHQDLLTRQRLDGPADLVVELISDSSVVRDREHKFDEYQAAGVREYWIIDPRPGSERADFYQLSVDGRYQPVALDDRGRYHAAVLPGFWLDTTWLLQDPLPDPLTCLAAMAPHILRAALTAAGPDASADEDAAKA